MKNFLRFLTIAVIIFAAACNQPKTETDDGSTQSDTDTVVTGTTAMYSGSSAACDDSRRYTGGEPGGGIGLSQDDAMSAIEAYRQKNRSSVTGFHLSKKALDSLFSVYTEANGIWIDLVNPRDIPKFNSNDTIAVIVSVRNNPHYELIFHSGNAAYVSENECPTMCERF